LRDTLLALIWAVVHDLGLGEGTILRLMKSFGFRGWMLCGTAALYIALPGIMAALAPALAGTELEQRKMPMRFTWVACQSHCQDSVGVSVGVSLGSSLNRPVNGWIEAVGIVTADTPRDFDEFAQGRSLNGATVVLDSSGGSVNDAIALGRRWRDIGLLTTVGSSVEKHTDSGNRHSVEPTAYCESMCVFLLLSGKVRYVPDSAHVRVHQIWMGDRADDARAASYSAQDMMIVERDIGRLAKFTFDMGGTGDLLSLALNVPPWEDLHELSPQELRLTNLVTTDAVADVLPRQGGAAMALNPKSTQDRFVSSAADDGKIPLPTKPTKTAEATAPTGGAAVAAPAQHQ
jgi:hypothetical protein